MNNYLFFSLLLLAFIAAAMFLLPHFASRRHFFAITVTPDFSGSDAGRKIVRSYHWQVAVAVLVCAAATVGLPQPLAVPGASLLMLVLAMAAFLWARSKVPRIAQSGVTLREADLTADGDRLPGWMALALPPFAIPIAVAAYLRAHWSQIPARFPVHWGIDGRPDGWDLKTAHSVYGPLLAGAGITLLILLIGLATFYGSRRAPQRTATLKIIVATSYLLAAVFAGVALMPLVHIPIALFLLLPMLFAAGVIAWSLKYVSGPSVPDEATPDECWHGFIYYNPRDSALFVQKRMGLGYTFNFGNNWSWLVLGGLLAGMGGMVLLLR